MAKIENTFRIFEQNKEKVTLAWWPDEMIKNISEGQMPEVWKQFSNLMEAYKKNENIIYVPDLLSEYSEEDIVFNSDAYYGDSGRLAHLFTRERKPVMLQDYRL